MYRVNAQGVDEQMINVQYYYCNWVYCVFRAMTLESFFPVLFLFWLGGHFMAPVIWSVKTCALGPPRPLSPSVPAVAGRLLMCVLPGHRCIWSNARARACVCVCVRVCVPAHVHVRARACAGFIVLVTMCMCVYMKMPACLPQTPARKFYTPYKWSVVHSHTVLLLSISLTLTVSKGWPTATPAHPETAASKRWHWWVQLLAGNTGIIHGISKRPLALSL